MDYEDAVSFLGQWGAFDQAVLVLLSLCGVTNGYLGIAMVFLADIPPHRCLLPALDLLSSSSNTTSSSTSSSSPSFSLDLNHSIPLEELKGELILSRCSRYKQAGGFHSNETEGCLDGWVFGSERYSSTIVTEWSLVCDNGWKAPFTMTVFFLGVLCGSCFSGYISDRYGRRVIFFTSMAVQTVFSLIQTASTTWEMFCVLYFIVAMGGVAKYCCGFILGFELLTSKARILFGAIGMPYAWALGYTILPLFAFYIRSWRWLLLALSLPGLLYVPLWWYIPESPRWLLAQGRIKEAELILRAAAKKNGVKAPEIIFKVEEVFLIQEAESGPADSQHRYSWLDLIRTTNIRNILLIKIILWVVISMTYYGVSLNTSNMDGDPYVNCLVSGATEFVGYSLTWLVMVRAPRRSLLPSLLLVSGLLLLVIKLIPDDVTVVLVMLGKMLVTSAFCFLYIYSMELFPTVVRNMALGGLSMASRIGGAAAPYIAYIGTYNKFLPYILMGGATVLAGLLSLLLPETKDQELPDLVSHTKPLVGLSKLFQTHSGPAELQKDQSALTAPNDPCEADRNRPPPQT